MAVSSADSADDAENLREILQILPHGLENANAFSFWLSDFTVSKIKILGDAFFASAKTRNVMTTFRHQRKSDNRHDDIFLLAQRHKKCGA